MIRKKCKICGTEFDSYLSSNRKFCSHKCYAESLKVLEKTKGNDSRNCKYCGELFKCFKSANQKFCSHKCFTDFNSGKNHSRFVKRVDEKCPQCGEIFECYKSANQKFCSKKCKDQWSSENIRGENHPNTKYTTKNCEICDDEFHACYKSARFCSSKCYGKWLSKNIRGENHPSWKGGISSEGYCSYFDEPLKVAVRSYFGNKCFMTNLTEKEYGQAMDIHHTGFDKRCGCNATQFCIFVPVTRSWNSKFNGNNDHNRWYWYAFIACKIFREHPNYFAYHIPVWGMNELEYNYDYVFEKSRQGRLI